MMRAAGIPARFEIGFPLPGEQKAGEIPGYHCWAQFYLDQVGWIPVDASEAWKKPEKRDYFFGAHDQHRVLFTTGRDIRLAPPQQGEPLNYFIYPYAEVDGKEFTGVETRFSFRDLPAPPD
jgi:transglutaminase-like putative cysteine protease